MQLKSFASLARTWQPVTWFAFAIQAPERPRRLTGCYVSQFIRQAVHYVVKPNDLQTQS